MIKGSKAAADVGHFGRQLVPHGHMARRYDTPVLTVRRVDGELEPIDPTVDGVKSDISQGGRLAATDRRGAGLWLLTQGEGS
jgi:hypothetical protein